MSKLLWKHFIFHLPDILSHFSSKKTSQPTHSRQWEPPSKQNSSPSPSPRALTKPSNDFPTPIPRGRGRGRDESPTSRKSSTSPDPIRALLDGGDRRGKKSQFAPKPTPRQRPGTQDSSPRSEDDSPRPRPRPRNKGQSEIDKILGIASSPEPEKKKKSSLFDEYTEKEGAKNGKLSLKGKERSKSPIKDLAGSEKPSRVRRNSPDRKNSPERRSPDLDDLLGLKKKSGRGSPDLGTKFQRRNVSPDRSKGREQQNGRKSPSVDDLLGIRNRKDRSPSPERNKEQRSEIDDILRGSKRAASPKPKPKQKKGLLDFSDDEDEEVSHVNSTFQSMKLDRKRESPSPEQKRKSPKMKGPLDALTQPDNLGERDKKRTGNWRQDERERRSPSPGVTPKPKPRVPAGVLDPDNKRESPKDTGGRKGTSRKNMVPGLDSDSDDDDDDGPDSILGSTKKKKKQKQSLLDVLDDTPSGKDKKKTKDILSDSDEDDKPPKLTNRRPEVCNHNTLYV